MRHLVLFLSILISIVNSTAFSQTSSLEDIIKEVSPAVVKIVVYDITGTKRGEGSGFFIGRGKIVTNAHVIKNAYSAEVHSFLKTYEDVTITKRDGDVDLALLAVQADGESTIALADGTGLRPGQRVIAIGNPLGLDRTVSDGLISAVRGIPGEVQVIQISAPISPGSSGGPLLNMQGSVIGVTSASLSEGQNLNFAIGIETLKQFLQKPDNPKYLKKARTRVLWRSILKWILNIIILIIALAFGGGWWIIFIVIMVFALLFYILMGLWGLITAPFRRKNRYDTLPADEEPYVSASGDIHTRQKSLFTEGDQDIEDEPDDEDLFYFHCWKCGELVEVDKSAGEDTVECEGCGTKLEIPKD